MPKGTKKIEPNYIPLNILYIPISPTLHNSFPYKVCIQASFRHFYMWVPTCPFIKYLQGHKGGIL